MYTFFLCFPFLRIVILWVLGICLFCYYPFLSNQLFCVLVAISGCIFVCRYLRIRFLLNALFCLLLPISAYLCAGLNAPKSINFDLHKVNNFVFEVIDFPEIKPKSTFLLVHCVAFLDEGQWKNGSGKFKLYVEKSLGKPVKGSRLLVRTQLNSFPKPSFPFEKNWSEYFKLKGIYASAYVPQSSVIRLNDAVEKKNSEFYFHYLQTFLAQNLARAMQQGINQDVAKTMLLGIKSSIDFETMAVYSSLGAIHILSVSGLHVGLLYAGLSFIFGFLLKRGRFSKMFFFFLMMVLLWGYAGISGFSDPVLRSAWMFSVMLFARAFLQQQNQINTLAFSCFVLLVFKPLSLFEPGFQLSYLAVFGLLIFQNKWSSLIKFKISNKPIMFILTNYWDLTCVALAAQIFTWPLIIYYFNQFPNPFWFLLLNPILIILSTISLALGFLFICVSPFLIFLKLDILLLWLGSLLDYSFSIMHFVMFKFVDIFHPIIPFLYIHVYDVFCYFLLIIFFCCWIVYRKLVFLLFFIFLINLACLFHIRPIPNPQISFLSQYKGYPIFVIISGVKSIYFAPIALRLDPLWIQGHLSPLWSNYGIKDTISKFYNQSINYHWVFKSKKFFLLNIAANKPFGSDNIVVLSKNVLMKKPIWLRSWNHSTLFFANKPSIYYQQIWPTYYPNYGLKNVDFLDQRAAVVY